jgi:tRNA U34 5-carboxymethylaminomethyl modifying GTPase MnmE/TrmE
MEAGGVPPTARPVPRIAVATRCDLVAEIDRATARPPVPGEHRTSARSGAGIDGLRRAIVEAVASLPAAGSAATLRLAAGLAAARTAVVAARDAAADGGLAGADEAVIAGLVREAVAALDEVTGDDFGVGIGTDLLDRIFSRHCIGK